MHNSNQLKTLPNKPGVYMMFDKLGNIIYIGKAKNLKNRVSQYFHNQKDRDPKVAEMITHIDRFHYKVLDTELDALIEECRLIKEIKPIYNSQMKNTKKYVYIKITKEEFPKLEIVKEDIEDSFIYFGPFTSLGQTENAVNYLEEFYPIRKCSTRFVKRVSGCLYGQLDKCLQACTGQVTVEEYQVHVEEICELLRGKSKEPLQLLLSEMEMAVDNLEFEKAAKYKEYYQGLNHVIGKQKLVNSSNKNKNILAVEAIDSEYAKLFLIKGNKLLWSKVFNRSVFSSSVNSRPEDTREFGDFLKKIVREQFAPDKDDTQKLGPQDIDEAQIIVSYLKKNSERIKSFTIPFSHLKNETALNTTTEKIIGQLNNTPPFRT